MLETVYSTVPLPVVLSPEVTVIHGTLLVADQLQPLSEAVTVTEPDPPDWPNEAEVGLRRKVQPASLKFATVVRVLFIVRALKAAPGWSTSIPMGIPL